MVRPLIRRYCQHYGQQLFWVTNKDWEFTSILQDEKKKTEPKAKEGGDEDDSEEGDGEKEHVVPEKLMKSFKIFARNDPKYPYQAIEASVKTMAVAVKRFQKTPAGTQELLIEIDNIPNVVSLYDMLKSSGIIQANRNVFKSMFSREVLLQKINELSWSNVTREAWVQAVVEADLTMSDDEEQD